MALILSIRGSPAVRLAMFANLSFISRCAGDNAFLSKNQGGGVASITFQFYSRSSAEATVFNEVAMLFQFYSRSSNPNSRIKLASLV